MEAGQAVRPERAETVSRAVKQWVGKLIETGRANNQLLYFRDQKSGTLQLTNAPASLLSDLLARRTVPLARLIPVEEELADGVRRARTIRKKSQLLFEESGIETLYLACGLATWEDEPGKTAPNSPVLLVPAQLKTRGSAQSSFELVVTGDLELNPSLRHVLQESFKCECDPEELASAAGIDGTVDTPGELAAAYDWLRSKASKIPGFAITEHFVLGTFSYAKLPMVEDLQTATDAIALHDLVSALAGDEQAQEALRALSPAVDPKAPDHTAPEDEFLVLPADSSQNYAINAVLAGQNLIVKGPPGTGKSQTISNLISSLVARGKRVLFVAEKRAAIDAVLKRLDSEGLGDLVLDLHSGAGSRRSIAKSLASALETNGKLAQVDQSALHSSLVLRREELNAHADAMHTVRDPWGVSYYQAKTELLGIELSARTPVRFTEAVLQRISGQTARDLSEDLRQLATLGGLTLKSSGSPWASATVVSTEDAQSVRGRLQALTDHVLPHTIQRLGTAADTTGLRRAERVSDWQAVVGLWSDVEQTLGAFSQDLYTQELPALITTLAPERDGGGARLKAKLLSKEFRTAAKLLKGLAEGRSLEGPALLGLLEAASDQATRWKDAASDGQLPSAPSDLAELKSLFEFLATQLSELGDQIGVQFDGTPQEIEQLLDGLLADLTTLARLPEIHRLSLSMRNAGLERFCEEIGSRALSPDACETALHWAWLSSIVEELEFTDSRISGFDGESHWQSVVAFRTADTKHIQTTAQRVRRLAAERAVAAQDLFPQEAIVVKDQAARKSRHMPIRQLFRQAPNVITAVKPCWVMSPYVVSQLLPSDKQYFDVVVFDEASQVVPENAIPAILRGKQLVVAGDERQLPPTDFFGATSSGEDDEADESDETIISVDGSYESILDALGPFIGSRSRSLTWHYRSRDERLIAFSNAHIYDRSLTTFPGVAGEGCVSLVLVDREADTGGSQDSSAAEVQRVVALILEHAENRPHESLGVIAMNRKHADRIEAALRIEQAARPDLEGFFDESGEERFFVKNLENVQGDERDAIILAVGYGKRTGGKLHHGFGYLSHEGGERRLNVAVTRARSRMTVVSTFSHNEMDPTKLGKPGSKMLREYLRFAASGGEDLGERVHEIQTLNVFEIDIRDALQKVDIPLVAQYGVSGYRIDFAAQHPVNRGQMVLAVECDGASYHSSQTARDRDRLRQEHLENLGWKFHRIWSTDWFNHRDREIQKARDAYQAAVAEADERASRLTASEDDEDDEVVVESPGTPPTMPEIGKPRAPRPEVPYGLTITEYEEEELTEIVDWIESDTLLRSKDQLIGEVMTELGFRRRGKRMIETIEQAIDLARVRRGS